MKKVFDSLIEMEGEVIIPFEEIKEKMSEPKKPNELIIAMRGRSEDLFKIMRFIERELNYNETMSAHTNIFTEDMKSFCRYEKKLGEFF